jgi:hypothetical protein
MDDRGSDRQTTLLLEALRRALADDAEHRLFKGGKLPGLFQSRTGPAGEAAVAALRDGYLESVRTEGKGKAAAEWVRLTPKGVDFVYRHDSPRAVLEEMRGLVLHARVGVPAWLDDILGKMKVLEVTFGEEMQKYLRRLDALTARVEEALRRVDAGVPALGEPLRAVVPWGLDALTYLDRRKLNGHAAPCPLPELFAAVRRGHPHLSVPDFQNGLKRLADNRALRLLPFTGPDHMPEPEHAIPDGAHMLYHAVR